MTRRPAGYGTPRRRDVLGMATGLATLVTLPSIASSRPGDTPTLKSAAAAGGLAFGAAGGTGLATDEPYRRLFVEQAALFTPENALKFDALQPREGEFRFAEADALVDGARREGLRVRGHTLAWNDWPPPWLKALSRAEKERAFDRYLERVVPHFAGRVSSWDVVNEPFWLGKDRPGTFRPGPWYDSMGIDYVFRAFRRTAELDPAAQLVLNEAWTESDDPVGRAVRHSLLNLVDRIQDKGLKLDGVGLQGHLLPQLPHDFGRFADFLHQLAERKVAILITEFDVDDESFPDAVPARDRAVAEYAASFLKETLAVPAVSTVITWGLSDRYTWWNDPDTMVAHGATRLARPLPYDDMLQKKPLWHTMAHAFRARRG